MNEEQRPQIPAPKKKDTTENLMDDFLPKKPAPQPVQPIQPAQPAQQPAAEGARSAKAPSQAQEKKPDPRATAAKDAPRASAKEAPRKTASTAGDSAKKNPNFKTGDTKSNPKDSGRGFSSTGSAAPNQKKDRDRKETVNMDLPRSAKPAHKIIPYVLIVLAIFIGVSLFLNLFCNMDNKLQGHPSDHWMGVFGYGICYGLFGLFGPAVFVLPLLLVNLALFWKKYIDHRLTISKIVVSFLFLVLLGTLIHIFCLTALEEADRALSAKQLLETGARMTGGGLIGGGLGYFFVKLMNFAGSLIVTFCLLFLSFFYFLGMTPHHVWMYLKNRGEMKEKRAPSATKQMAKEAGDKAKVDEKIRRVVNRNTTDGAMTDPDGTPAGAVQVVETPKKAPKDKLAPMPIPNLDPNDGSEPFVPNEINRNLADASLRKADSAPQTPAQSAPAPAQPAPAPQASAPAAQPAPAPAQPAPAAKPAEPMTDLNPAENRDGAIDPIFPKTSDRSQPARKIPREDRNFDIARVFSNQKAPAPQQQTHAPVPPESPMVGSRRPVPAQPGQPMPAQRPVQPGQPMPAQRPVQPGQPMPAGSAPRTGTLPNAAAPTPQKKADMVLKKATVEQEEFGFSDTDFEKMEQNNPKLPPVRKASTAPGEKQTVLRPTEKKQEPLKDYVFPPITYLRKGEPVSAENLEEIEESSRTLTETLKSFKIPLQGDVSYACGPSVTRFEVVPAPGIRGKTIVALADDLARALKSDGGVRVEATIPGTNAVGIEIPNKKRSLIYLRDLIECKAFTEHKSKLAACLGAGITGEPLIFDIAKMPHLLIAGTTGSGKSVCINSIIMSLLYRARPDEVKLILIDPKKVEFGTYKNIPHLMAPVVTTPKNAAGALQAAVDEMEHRFELFESVSARDLKGYNNITKDDPEMPFLPQIVIIIDELADLMMTTRDEVENAICRIAQKARAAGMHLIIGTQRPSIDVVTGLIKANIPSRIAFAVKAQVDSRTILDHIGAESLIGLGDMLFVPIGARRDTRVQGAFVDDKEVEHICEFIRSTNGTAVYDEHFLAKMKELADQCGNKGKGGDFAPPPPDGDTKGDDSKYADAVRVVIEEKRASTSLLQRRLEIGYSRAAKLLDRMQEEGFVSAADGAKPRTILITPEEYMERFIDGASNGDGDSEDEDE